MKAAGLALLFVSVLAAIALAVSGEPRGRDIRIGGSMAVAGRP